MKSYLKTLVMSFGFVGLMSTNAHALGIGLNSYSGVFENKHQATAALSGSLAEFGQQLFIRIAAFSKDGAEDIDGFNDDGGFGVEGGHNGDEIDAGKGEYLRFTILDANKDEYKINLTAFNVVDLFGGEHGRIQFTGTGKSISFSGGGANSGSGGAKHIDVDLAALGIDGGVSTWTMVAYGKDSDYAPHAFRISGIGGDTSVPEPGTMLLLGSGLTGLAARRRRLAKLALEA